MLIKFAWVCSGAVLGAAARFGCYLALKGIFAPIATLSVNLLGSFFLGCFSIAIAEKLPLGMRESAGLFFATGMLGSFTTFSALSKDIFELLEKRPLLAIAWAILQISLGVVVFFVGLKVGRLISRA